MKKRILQLDEPQNEVSENLLRAEAALEDLAATVRRIYCMLYGRAKKNPRYGETAMPAWDGGTTPFGARRKAVWPKIARTILQIGADPLEFIHAQFVAVPTAHLPTPNQLLGDPAISKWNEHRESVRQKLQDSTRSDFTQINLLVIPAMTVLKMSQYDATEYAITTNNPGISPLSRYCVAAHYSIPVDNQLINAAMAQYFVQSDEYDSVLPLQLPATFRQAARQLKTHVLGLKD